MQASDKEKFLARFVTVERTVKDSIHQQLAAELALDGKVASHTAALKQLVARAEERARGAECVLRDQVEAAMGRLRAYAREVEEALDQVCSQDSVRVPACAVGASQEWQSDPHGVVQPSLGHVDRPSAMCSQLLQGLVSSCCAVLLNSDAVRLSRCAVLCAVNVQRE